MSQRLHDTTKWFWCLLILYSGPSWNPVRCVAVRTPSNGPSAIETQAKFFQYRHFPSAEDYDQGHRLGSDRHFTERHERSRPSTGLFSAKIRWGDKKGGYGEHYWDLNHAGHTGDHGDDDGSYRERDSGDSYDEPNDQSSNYDSASYDLVNAAHHDDSGREKRAPKRVRTERGQEAEELNATEKPQLMRKSVRKQKEQKEVPSADNEEQGNENQEVYRKPASLQQKHLQKEPQGTEENKTTKEKNHVVLVVDEKDKEEKPMRFVPRHPDAKVFVPYEGGAGIRQHYQAEILPVASVPRLFLEPATGHVVDRATGQAYVLQPINRNPSYS